MVGSPEKNGALIELLTDGDGLLTDDGVDDGLDFLDSMSDHDMIMRLGEVEAGLFEFRLVKEGIKRRLKERGIIESKNPRFNERTQQGRVA